MQYANMRVSYFCLILFQCQMLKEMAMIANVKTDGSVYFADIKRGWEEKWSPAIQKCALSQSTATKRVKQVLADQAVGMYFYLSFLCQ